MSFKKESVDEFLEIFHSSREKILSMPGCHRVELLKDVDDPTVFTTYSKWDSKKDLDNYRNSKLFGELWPRTKALFREKAVAFSSITLDI